jgi:hypothetical protein
MKVFLKHFNEGVCGSCKHREKNHKLTVTLSHSDLESLKKRIPVVYRDTFVIDTAVTYLKIAVNR